jgi:hypothetical protein
MNPNRNPVAKNVRVNKAAVHRDRTKVHRPSDKKAIRRIQLEVV